MNKLLNKGLVVFAAAAMIATFNFESVSAQRPSRSGGGSSGGRSGSVSSSGGGNAMSRGSVSTSRQPSAAASSSYSRVSRTTATASYSSGQPNLRMQHRGYGYNRPGYGYRNGGIYRMGYGRSGYNRAYFGYYNYYRPYIGFRLNILPYGYYPFYYGQDHFYYSGGLFYRQYENNYQVVVPPVGAEVPTLPAAANLVTIDGIDYYEYKGVYYTQTQSADGKTVYVVAGKDGVLNTTGSPIDTHQIGDIIKLLPEGCRPVTIKNEKYYVSPDDVYYEEVADGSNISYRVIGKLF